MQLFYKYKCSKNIFSIEKNAYLKMYLKLKNKNSKKDISLMKKEKKEILQLFSQGRNNTNMTSIDKLFYTSNFRFGNILSNLNKLIFFCEIIKCKSIILDKKSFWFIKNKTYIPYNNIFIEVGDYNKSFYLFNNSLGLFFSLFHFKPEIRINFLRKEIFSNLPKINGSKEYLYIHIRSGDIFLKDSNIFYSQPPLCFYQTILINNHFSKIYLISSDKENPVIEKIINQFPKVIFNQNSLKTDISLLMNAYNYVNSISSFSNLIIQLSNNLEFLWDYNIYKTSEKVLLYHYDLYKYPHNKFTIFRMEPSPKYREKMYFWRNNFIQRRLMTKEKCDYYFSIINKEV